MHRPRLFESPDGEHREITDQGGAVSLVRLTVLTPALVIRPATDGDLPAVVRLLADDTLGATRERPDEPLAPQYAQAFAAIQAQSGNHLLVATRGDVVVGCLQLTIIPGMSRLGTVRGLIEGVRVASAERRQKVGEAMVRDAIERCRAAGCALVQLTSDVSRVDARRFYEKLGFAATHVGMKLTL